MRKCLQEIDTMKIDRLKEIREDRDYTQKEIAELLKVKQQQYSKYELGINIIPLEKICVLADFYNTSVDYLLCRTDDIKPYPRSSLLPKNKDL